MKEIGRISPAGAFEGAIGAIGNSARNDSG